jgi:phospholipase/carboxylesterase
MRNETIYFRGTSLRRCLLRFPEDSGGIEKIPLVIGLHGGGGHFEKFVSLWDEIDERKFIFGALEAPYAFGNDEGISYEWAMWPLGNRDVIIKATKQTQEYIADAVREISQKLQTDNVYLLGFSQGAIIGYSTGIMYHPLFKVLICLSGPGLLETMTNPFGAKLNWEWLDRDQIKKAKELPVLIAHGTEDQAAKYELAVQSKKRLVEYGYNVSLLSFIGGHIYPPKEVMAEIAKWIARNAREPHL